jgi:integrase
VSVYRPKYKVNGETKTVNVWWYKFRFAGQVVRESSKSESKTLAKDAERARRRQLEEGYNGIVRREKAQTFPTASKHWLDSRLAHVAPRTIDLYELALDHLKKHFGGLLLSDISAADIASYQGKRSGAGAAGRTVNLEVAVLRAIMKKSKLWGAISDDVQFLKERRDVGRAISPEQESTLLKVASEPRYSDSALYPIVVLALNTAMRSQEIKTLRWSQVDLIHRSLIVGKSKTEAGSGRLIPLNQSAVTVLAKWASRTPEASPEHFVFPACENHKIDPSRPIASFRTAWRNVRKAAGLTGLRFHDLRHTAITKLAESMTSEQTIMSIAGHVSRRMLEHYSHIRMDAKRTAVEAISQPVSVGSGAQNWAQSPDSQKGAVPN